VKVGGIGQSKGVVAAKPAQWVKYTSKSHAGLWPYVHILLKQGYDFSDSLGRNRYGFGCRDAAANENFDHSVVRTRAREHVEW